MSQTQPELKNMVSTLFGESSDEEDDGDDLGNDSPIKLSTTPSLKSTAIDEDDLFNSDDESEDEEPVAVRRLSKGPVTKKVPIPTTVY